MDKPTPISNRSTPKSLGLKILGGLLLAVGALAAMFGMTIVRAAFFDVFERPETLSRARWYFTAGCLVLASVGMLLGHFGWKTYRRGRKFNTLSAEEMLARDPRPPVVYIRSFRDDDRLLATPERSDLWVSRLFMPVFLIESREEILAGCLSKIGPVVAIGNPREVLPELGAARMYFRDDEWQEKILAFMLQARLVVLLGGPTKNLWWEIENALKILPPERLLCVVPKEKDGSDEEFLREFAQKIGQPYAAAFQAPPPESGWNRWQRAYGRILFFEKNWSPQASFIHGLSLKMFFYNQTINQFEPALRVALRPVFARLGLSGPRLRVNKWTVFLVALVGLTAAFFAFVALWGGR